MAFMYTCENNGQSFIMKKASVCNQNGNWDPNPANICGKSLGMCTCAYSLDHLFIVKYKQYCRGHCILIFYNITGIFPTVHVQKLNRETIVAIVLSISVFIVSSAVFIILGFACGYCYSQKRYKWTSSKAQNVILASEFGSEFSKDLELRENAAYGIQCNQHHVLNS